MNQTKSSELSGPVHSSGESVGSDVSDLCDSPRADSPRAHEHSVEVLDSELEVTEVQLLDKPASHVAVGSVRARLCSDALRLSLAVAIPVSSNRHLFQTRN